MCTLLNERLHKMFVKWEGPVNNKLASLEATLVQNYDLPTH